MVIGAGDDVEADFDDFERDFDGFLFVFLGANISSLTSSPRSSAATTALERNLPAWSRGER